MSAFVSPPWTDLAHFFNSLDASVARSSEFEDLHSKFDKQSIGNNVLHTPIYELPTTPKPINPRLYELRTEIQKRKTKNKQLTTSLYDLSEAGYAVENSFLELLRFEIKILDQLETIVEKIITAL